MRITFEGFIDHNRSDEILPGRNDTPLWNHTLGYSKFLVDEDNAAAHQAAMLSTGLWGYLGCHFGCCDAWRVGLICQLTSN